MPRVRLQDLVEILMHVHVDQMPIIETGTLQMLVIDGKAQGLHQMQLNARVGTGAGDIARVAGNLRLYQNDMQKNTPQNTYFSPQANSL
jgi:hypothetical protein